jgi:hypothetical protein
VLARARLRACVHGCVRACTVACARARMRACARMRLRAYVRAFMVSCARSWLRACVRACLRACVHVYVPPARVRPSRFTILFVPHTHCSLYRTTRQNYIFSVRACAVASVLRAYTVACAIAWFCARVHGCVRACVRASI